MITTNEQRRSFSNDIGREKPKIKETGENNQHAINTAGKLSEPEDEPIDKKADIT